MTGTETDIITHIDVTKSLGRRGAARFAAIQALYQLEMGGAASLEPILMEYLTIRGHQTSDGIRLGAFDTALMEHVVRGVVENFEDIDIMLLGVMADGWTINRLDSVLRAILRAATYELAWDEETPGPVIINEYVNIARTFFNDREPGFVNASLDSIQSVMRSPDQP